MSKLVSFIILVQVVKDGTVVPAVNKTFELWVLAKLNSSCVRTSQIVHNMFTHFVLAFN